LFPISACFKPLFFKIHGVCNAPAAVTTIFAFMKNVLFLTAFYIFTFLINQELPAQSGKFLQIELNAGISEPLQEFRSQHMFTGRGMSAAGGFDYFFNHFGIGFSGGYFTNESGQSFTSYIEHKYFEKLKNTLNSDIGVISYINPADYDNGQDFIIKYGKNSST